MGGSAIANPKRAPRSVRLALWGLLIAGTVIRLPHLAAPPLEFHASRQYRSAALARGYVLDALPGYSVQERHAATVLAALMSPIEPPVFERAAALLYRTAGQEALWMPRLLGVLAWIGGAVAMWWLVAPLLGALAGLAGVAVYLFLPYGVAASQAFQPDGLMTALTVAAIAASFWRHRHPSTRAARVATLVAMAAVFIKPMAVFFILPVEVGLSTARDGWLRGLRRSAAWAAAIATPAAVWYVYVTMTAASVLKDRFFPQLLTRSAFWTGWLKMIERVVPWPVLVLAILGVITVRGTTRRGLLAAWMGYVTFGLAFSYHIHTHDYYSLPLIPLVGWSAGALVSAVRERARAGVGRFAPYVMLGLVAMAVGVGWQARPYAPDPASAAEVARYERIGRLVGHSARVISLDGDYGYPLSYHGRLVASNLPLSIDAAVSGLAGRGRSSPETRPASMNGEFFVATSQAEFGGQPGLRAFLDERYPVVARDGTPERWHFVVYDLRHTRVSVTPGRLSAFARVGDRAAPRVSAALWAEPDAHWRVVVPAPALLDVTPIAGAGPATLTFAPRPATTEADRVVDVAIYGEGQETASATVGVRVRVIPAGPPMPPFGYVDAPPDPVTVDRAPVVFQGWALDDLSTRRVWVCFRNRVGSVVPLGDAKWSGMRPDVAAAHPNAHDIFNSAWTFTLDPEAVRTLPQPLTMLFYAEDGEGLCSELGRRTLRVKR
jgi:hypothetical protein